MIRTTFTPKESNLNISIPQNYIEKKNIEVLLFAVDEILEDKPKALTMADFWNTISNETAEELHSNVEQMREEW